MDILKVRHNFLKTIREFFYNRSYLEVETSHIMATSPPDPFIDPLKVFIGEKGPYYLHTSPELNMKKLLQVDKERIFQICKVFRVEELEEIHSIEFTMLEWYMKGTYGDAMNEAKELIQFIVNRLFYEEHERYFKDWPVYDLETLFVEKTGINPFALDREGLFSALTQKGFKGINVQDDWNDLFFKLFIQEVEESIRSDVPYFIKDWPLSISTMAERKGTMKVERFELYIDGCEIANGYTELLNAAEQRKRFEKDNATRRRLGKETFPVDEQFLNALSKASGPYTGVSIGVDRLLMVLLHKKTIDEVMVNRFKV